MFFYRLRLIFFKSKFLLETFVRQVIYTQPADKQIENNYSHD